MVVPLGLCMGPGWIADVVTFFTMRGSARIADDGIYDLLHGWRLRSTRIPLGLGLLCPLRGLAGGMAAAPDFFAFFMYRVFFAFFMYMVCLFAFFVYMGLALFMYMVFSPTVRDKWGALVRWFAWMHWARVGFEQGGKNGG